MNEAPTRFTEWPRQTQLKALRAFARQQLEQFDLPGASVRLINYGYNATYRVEASGQRRYAMRINLNSTSSAEDIAIETAWVRALADECDVAVAQPVVAKNGSAVVLSHFAPLGRTLPVVVYRWLDGPDLGDRASAKRIGQLGQAAARLHIHAERWRTPPGATIRTHDHALFGCSDPKRLPALQTWLPKSGEQLLGRALDRVNELTQPVLSAPNRHIIHADLHPYNSKWVDGEVAVFDFDDAGLGSPLLDLAISAYYLRDQPSKEHAMLEGYASIRDLPEHTSEQFEALLAGRNLQLVIDVVASVNVNRDFVQTYLVTTTKRMREFLDTGVFILDA